MKNKFENPEPDPSENPDNYFEKPKLISNPSKKWKKLGNFAAFIALSVVGAFYTGFLLHQLYVWFIQTVYPSLPDIGYLKFYGISLFVRALTFQLPVTKTSEYEKNMYLLSYAYFAYCTVVLIFGYILSFFV